MAAAFRKIAAFTFASFMTHSLAFGFLSNYDSLSWGEAQIYRRKIGVDVNADDADDVYDIMESVLEGANQGVCLSPSHFLSYSRRGPTTAQGPDYHAIIAWCHWLWRSDKTTKHFMKRKLVHSCSPIHWISCHYERVTDSSGNQISQNKKTKISMIGRNMWNWAGGSKANLCDS